jgi:hypothetical protein
MAGTRHHILPRFLLKGFPCRRVGDETYTFVYWKGRPSFEANIEKVAVEKHFYGEGEESADDTITDLEGPFGALVDRLRAISGTANEPAIPSLILHLAHRTKHIRESVTQAGDLMFAELERHLQNPHRLRAFVMRPEWIDEEINTFLKDHPPNRFQIRTAKETLRRRLLQEFDNNPESTKEQAAAFFRMIRKKLRDAFREGHLRSLLKDPAVSARLDWYSHYTWHVQFSETPFVLSDAGCLFRTANGRFKLLDSEDDRATQILLPISNFRLLVDWARRGY